MAQQEIGTEYLADVLRNFRSYKKLAEDAMEQTTDEEIFRLIDPEANSVAMLIKHMAGNMRSRWTDFLTTDGEKPNRHRDRELVGRRMAMRIQRHHSAPTRGPHAQGVHRRARALSFAGHNPAIAALCRPRQSDRAAGKTLPWP